MQRFPRVGHQRAATLRGRCRSVLATWGIRSMWQEILTAFALYLIIEGMIPFIGPQAFRRTVERIGSLSDNNLRLAGLAAMGAGLLLLFIVRA